MFATNSSSDSSPGQVDVRVHPPSGTIILRRPQRCNALSRAMMGQLIQALDDLHRQLSVRAVILTGAGDHFCSGLDLVELRDQASQPDAQISWEEDVHRWHDVVEKLLRFPKPVIAAVNGPAHGGGAALVLAADLVVGCPHARLGFPEPRRGLVSGLATPLLAFRLGAAAAAQLLLLAGTAEPSELHRRGLYHDLVEPDQVWARAHEWAQEIAGLSHESLALTKRLLNEEVGQQLITLLSVGAAASATAWTTEAAAEGIEAFLEKRPPKWPGPEDV